jgi:hypothetical protein
MIKRRHQQNHLGPICLDICSMDVGVVHVRIPPGSQGRRRVPSVPGPRTISWCVVEACQSDSIRGRGRCQEDPFRWLAVLFPVTSVPQDSLALGRSHVHLRLPPASKEQLASPPRHWRFSPVTSADNGAARQAFCEHFDDFDL